MAEAASATGMILRVYTHPACSGCSTAVERAWRLAEGRPGLALETVSLERPEGLAAARAAGVTTIPTTVLAGATGELDRWVGTPAEAELAGALERAPAAARRESA